MFYTGVDIATGTYRIGYARSSNGIAWTKHPTPVLNTGPNGSWDQIGTVCGGVVMIRDTFHIWYTGFDGSGIARIGYAKSPRVNVGVDVANSNVPSEFSLGQNYPNPFNPSTMIRYGLPHKSDVQLLIFNTLGQQVSVLQNGEQEAGYHEVQFNGTALSSGVYFYRLRAGGFVETKQLLLLR